MTSGSSHRPGTMPRSRMWSSTSSMPPGNRVCDGCHSPTLSHQCPPSSYQPASMQKTSAPRLGGGVDQRQQLAVVGSPMSVFM